MRPLSLSLGAIALLAGAAVAQNAGDSGGGNMPQLPVGQTFKQFEFPVYQEGRLKYTLSATEATGITLNRAETTHLIINVFDDSGTNNVPTTVITSPKADLLVAEQKMRTKNTVQIERSDMEASSQSCDFDVKEKKYLMRTNVKVLLKHFDVGANTPGAPKPGTVAAGPGTRTNAASPIAPIRRRPRRSTPTTRSCPPPAPTPTPTAGPFRPPIPRTNEARHTAFARPVRARGDAGPGAVAG
ncbi:MAG: LPS export ABC transporter periplasmic protein LptC [Verrucomicrobiota bacterium]